MSFGIDQLIVSLKGARSYDQLSKDCGGIPTPSRLSVMVNQGIGAFPSVETIRGLAHGLDVPTHEVIQACGVSLSLLKDGSMGTPFPLPHGAERLQPAQKAAVVSVVREFVRANQGGE